MAKDEARCLALADTSLVLDAGTGLDVVSDRQTTPIAAGLSTVDEFVDRCGQVGVAPAQFDVECCGAASDIERPARTAQIDGLAKRAGGERRE